MDRIKSLKFENKIYKDPIVIESILLKNGFNWLNLAEIENAVLEIKKDKLYWNSGIWYYGDWHYGIWLDGIFKYGNWYNGVWYNGMFKNGTWHNGIWMNGDFNGDFREGEFRKGTKNGKNINQDDNIQLKELKGNNEKITGEKNLEILKFKNYIKK